ncbi:MAG: ABC transporter ATP-binding protein [Silicimonas sp.]|nr:ABC transporter ATP-binding protein [Silicimonas sp.]NND18096.1 ABC transporter ATP-binding protein [Silicimonas sp.]NNF92233.1 ABC transporter ATP-binding protein [Boseongicola sp.]NNL36030.1 ABC transporter ATP-binding protein [Silicimonas sp.]RZW06103.1 MAG: ABC transporter ATP-binding protein [Paracoccaceae bacterium]
MIRLVDVSKTFYSDGVARTVADRINLVIPDAVSVALIGRNGAGKSSLLKIISGAMRPNSGRVEHSGSISWPVGFSGSFHGDLSGLQNVRFVARIYGVDTDQLVDFVHEVSELGDQFFLPFRTYSQGMRARLGFATSMGIDFDTYLIDEVTSVGDESFRQKSEAMLRDRLSSRGAVVVSHNGPLLKRMCEAAVVIENGEAIWFDDVDAALAQHRAHMHLDPAGA